MPLRSPALGEVTHHHHRAPTPSGLWCLNGFEPKNPTAWVLRDGSDGCVRTPALNCRDDGFLTLIDMKLPDTSIAVINSSMTLADCEQDCRSNCSCTAYTSMDITGAGSGCVIWVDDLLDMRQYAAGGKVSMSKCSYTNQ